MSTLRIGIAGFGIVGKRRKECVDRHPGMEVVAVCDRTFTEDRTLPGGIKSFCDYRSLLGETLDAVIVCMTNDIAAEVTIAGLTHGLHVFCEKPPARTVAEVHAVIAAERRHPGLKLMYGFNHRYHDSVRDALKIVRSGELGRLINMRGVYGKSRLSTFNQSNWRTNRAVAGGGVLLDQGIHMVDLMRLFAGEFTEVHSVVSNSYWGFEVEDNAYALMRTDSGVVGMLNSSATQWRHMFQLDMALERGSVTLSGILSGTKSYGAETLTVVHANPDTDAGDPKEQTTRYNHDPSWDDEMAAFASSILDGTEITSGNSNDALRTMQLVNRIYFEDPRWRAAFSIPDPNSYE